MTLGEKLHTARIAQNLSPEELAAQLQVPVSCIIAWEEDMASLIFPYREALFEILHITAKDLTEIRNADNTSSDTPISGVAEDFHYQAETSPTPIATAEDYWNTPAGTLVELMDGKLYFRNTPDTTHQLLVSELCFRLQNHITTKGGSCLVLSAPFTVNLDADNQNLLQPDILVVCDRTKLTPYECKGAPDFVVEIVSKISRKTDYITKHSKYAVAGVREYWIVDPQKQCTTIYHFEEDAAPMIVPFDQLITVEIFGDLRFCIGDFAEKISTYIKK